MPKIEAGQTVFAPDDEECFVLATVREVQGNKINTVTKSGRNISSEEAYPFEPNDQVQGDLVQMENVDTANILNTLRMRHKAGHAYTKVGQNGIVISVNPYKWVDICACHSLQLSHALELRGCLYLVLPLHGSFPMFTSSVPLPSLGMGSPFARPCPRPHPRVVQTASM